MKTRWILVGLLIISFLVQIPTRKGAAQGPTGAALIINGPSSLRFIGTRINATDTLRRLLRNRGLDVTVSEDVPADLSPFQCVFDIRFTDLAPITAGEITTYVNYLADGGQLYVTGENGNFAVRNSSVISLVSAAGGGSLTFCSPVTEGDLIRTNTPTCVDPIICSTPNTISTVRMAFPGGTTDSGTGSPLLASVDAGGAQCNVASVWRGGQLSNAPAGLLVAMFDIDILTRSLPDLDDDSMKLADNLLTFICQPNNPPIAMCRDVVRVADENCQVVVTAEEIDDGSFDPDDHAITLRLDPPGPFTLGTTTVTLTVTDERTVTATCTATITVVDLTPPTVVCPTDIIAECTSPDGAVVNFPAPTVSDNCDANPTVVYAPPSGSRLPIGVTPVVVTVTDASGNSTSCTFNASVVDTTPPVVTCPADITVECTSPEGAVVTYTATATDICDPNPTVACSPPSGSLFAIGTATVTCTATDAMGNNSSCSFAVNIVDTTAPDIVCPQDIQAECSRPDGAVVTFTVRATDLCDPTPSIVCTPSSGSTFALGTTTVTCTATDDSSNRASCSFTVTVVDTTPPSITCPSNVTAECTSPNGATVTFLLARASDICDPDVAVSCTPPSGSTFPLGATEVACTATDDSGNSSSCTFTVTVIDTTPPVITCPADITVECTSPQGAVVSYTATAVDVCDPGPTVICSPPSGTLFPFGTTSITCIAADANENSARCSFTVTVVDTIPPVIECPTDITAECTGDGGAPVPYATPRAQDACDASPTVACTPPSGSRFPLGSTDVTCVATDDTGNTSVCDFRVTVVDTQPPRLNCPPNITEECTSPEGDVVVFTVTATDRCDPGPTVACSPTSGSIFPLGVTTVSCRATDTRGNTATCTFTVTVVDTTPPAIRCPANITAECTNPEGAAVAFNVTASDACDRNPRVSCSPRSGSLFPLGTTTVLCVATDQTGNSNRCSFTVTVVDTTPPEMTCPADITAECTSPGGVVITFPLPRTVDICDPHPTVVCSPTSGSTFQLGTTVVICTATDDAGNNASCSFRVRVIDTTPPVLVCPGNMTKECTSPSGAVVTFTPRVTDTCDQNPTLVCTPPSATTFPIGTTTVNCVATDASRNRSQCSFTVTVVDTIPPVITCPDPMTLECTSPQGAVATFAATAIDTCDANPAIACVPPSGSTFALGTTQVTCVATDDAGNSSSCNFTVTVVDTTPPGITCPANITAECTSPSGAVVTYPIPGTVDICDPNPTVVCTPPSGTQFAIGTTTVNCVATDASGNSSRCSFVVNVVDTTPPTINCPGDIRAECTSPDGAVVSFTTSAIDICDATPVVVCTPSSGSLFPIGTTTVTCTATDDAGNSSRCSFNITVVDTIPPAITCPADITTECTSPAGAIATFAATATDTCDPNPTIVCTPPSGSTFMLGTTAVNCVATDDAGNRSDCGFNVTVVDTTPPTITCPAPITTLCTSPVGAVVTFTILTTDICDASPSVVCTPPSGSIFALGTTTVTCTATDDSGNSTSCSFTITVFNNPPTVDAGPDQVVDEGTLVQLAGSGADPDPGHTLAFEWTQIGGQAVTLIGADTATASFTAPDVPVGQVEFLTFELKVIDPCGATATDIVQVRVRDRIEGADNGNCVKITLDDNVEEPTTGTYCWRTNDGRVFSGPVVITRQKSVFGRLVSLHVETLPGAPNRLRVNVDQPLKDILSGRLTLPSTGLFSESFTILDRNRSQSSCACP